MTSPAIREMLLDDVEQIAEIEQQISQDPWSTKLITDCIKVGYYCYTLKTQDEEIIGYGMINESAAEAHIINLAIAQTWQGQGFGTLMLEHLINIAKTKAGAETIFLEVRSSNQVAIELYKKYQFQEIGIRKEYYPKIDSHREDALVMQKKL